MEILVNMRNVYGNDLIYPICEKAKLFAAIAQSRTLSLSTIEAIKALGYRVEVEQVVKTL